VDARIVLAGRIAVQIGDATVDERVLSGRQPRLAFTLLVVERHRPVTSEELAENLWPEQRPDTWQTALRGVVSRVRGFIVAAGVGPREAVHAHAGTYQLLPPRDLEVDIERAVAETDLAAAALAVEDAAGAADLAARARSVLARPLLPGIDSSWVEARRRELALALHRALDVLGEARLRSGDQTGAATAAEAAIAADPFRESAYRLLIRAFAAAGDGAAGLRVYDRCRDLLALELGVDPAPETQALHLELLQRPTVGVAQHGGITLHGTRATPATSEPPAAGVPPYLGLQTFDERDAGRFFGRTADVTRLLDRLAETRFLAVVGSSGSGKSSLVRAGLIPALRRGALPGSDTWAVRVLRPGAAPVRTLAHEVVDLDRSSLDREATFRRLSRDGRELHELVGRACRHGLVAERVLVVVDQLEEAFTLGTDVEQRRAFLDNLTAAATVADGRTIVIATLRADFYGRLAEHPRLADLASAHQFLVTPMDEVGLADAIEGPAQAAGLQLEPRLTETVLRDVARQPGALPLLGHALLELWRRRSGSLLTLDGYRATGGVEGALAQRAEAVYGSLAPDEQVVTRRVMLRLTQPGNGTGDTRRRVAFAELVNREEERATVERVVATLTDARLLTTGGPPNGERHVEVAHEALIRGWPRLRAWIDEDRGGLLVHRRLTAAASEWERLEKEPGALYRGVQLSEAAAWAERDGATNPVERTFLAASLEAQSSERRRRVRRLRVTVAALAVGLLLTGALSVFSLGQTNRLGDQVAVANARELAAAAVANLDVDAERSILLALEAVESTRVEDGSVVREAEEALHRAVRASRIVATVPSGGYLAVTSDGSRFAIAGGASSAVTLWDTATGAEVALPAGPIGTDTAVTSVAFSADDRLLATTHEDGAVRLWDASSGEEVRVMLGHQGPAMHPIFSPDGRHLATGGVRDGTVRVWDVETGAEHRRLPSSGSSPPAHLPWPASCPRSADGQPRRDCSVAPRPAFSPDGSTLLVNDGLWARVWDLETGTLARNSTGHDLQVNQATFSPTGDRLVTIGEDGLARISVAESGATLQTIVTAGSLRAVAFGPGGTRIATAGSDGIARVWDARSGRGLLTLPGHVGALVDVAFTPEGDRLLTSGRDGTTRLWDVSVGGARGGPTVPTAEGFLTGVAFGPDGATFAAPAEPAGVTIWDTETGEEVRTLEGSVHARVTTVVFSPDGRQLAAASDALPAPDVWDVDTGELLLTLDSHLAGSRTIAFSADGAGLISGSRDGWVRIWDAATGEQQEEFRSGGVSILSLAASPDGRFVASGDQAGAVSVWDLDASEWAHRLDAHTGAVNGLAFGGGGALVTASEDGTARVWDLATGRERSTFRGHNAPVHRVAVNPDGTRVATASDDRTVKLWDPTDGRELLTLTGHDNAVFGVAFSPDGRLLASAGLDGTVTVHLLPIDELVDVARERVTRDLTTDECRQYLPRGSCPEVRSGG
jgi:WD40 repeat protein/DNA-binding SARP family transcriptional activator